MNTIQQILASLQAGVQALATYVASLPPVTTTVPQNIAAAITALQSAVTQFNTDFAANLPVAGGTIATVLAADATAIAIAVAVLQSALASPSNP